MSNDVSRFLEQPIKHYAGVRLQQGRVLLDSDFNEDAYLNQDDARRAWLDLVGPDGSPDQGFSIGPPIPPGSFFQPRQLRPGDAVEPVTLSFNGLPTLVRNVTIRAGTMLVGGMRLDLERPESLAFQRDYLQLRDLDLPLIESPPDFRDFYFLHAWEQPVSAIEDQELAEVMLRGEHPGFRIRRMRRIEVIGNLAPEINTCEEALDVLLFDLGAERASATAFSPEFRSLFDERTFELKSKGRLRLTFSGGGAADTCGPCDPDDLGYLGSSNTALRILLTSADQFVWGLDNAAPLFRVRVTGLDAVSPEELDVEVEMLTPPVGEEQLPVRDRVVEILPFSALLDGGNLPSSSDNPHARKVAAEIGLFARVAKENYDPKTRKFKLSRETDEDRARLERIRDELVHVWPPEHPDAGVLNTPAGDDGRYFYARLWHQAPNPEDIELVMPDAEGGPALGDTGIAPVLIEPGRRGDFWVATLRVDTPEQIVPLDLTSPEGVPPQGPRHFYAPIAIVRGEGSGDAPDLVAGNSDCRSRLRKVNDLDCVTAVVGDGVSSTGEFLSIQAAIDSLPSSGGRVAIRPGHYKEEIRIRNRRDVIIEGCGAATLIEPPLLSPSGVLIEVIDSEGISMTGLTLHAVEQTAVAVRRVMELALTELSIVAGRAQDGLFSPGGRFAESPLLDLLQIGSAKLLDLSLETGRRPALVANACELVTLRDITAVGSAAVERPPTSPMVSIVNSELVKFEDSRLETFGQVGVSVRGNTGRDIELRSLTIRASSHEIAPEDDDEEAAVTVSETQTAVDIEDGENVRLVSSHITLDGSAVSEHAAVVVRGKSVVVQDNTIDALIACHDDASPSPAEVEHTDLRDLIDCQDLRAAFGGIQVRGGASSIEIRRNRITGGIGHGITLGSVIWHLASSPRGISKRVAGAGGGQLVPHLISGNVRGVALGRNLGEGFEDDDSRDYLPVSEGSIQDLVIAENRIERAFASGISVLTVFGLLNHGGEFIELENARIYNNTITNNLARPGVTMPDTGDVVPFRGSLAGPTIISMLPFGGIVLATAQGVDIRDNVIQDNVPVDQGAPGLAPIDTDLIPINGIFILNGEGITITGNRIINNGKRSPPEFLLPNAAEKTLLLRPGIRAGIGVMFAGTGFVDDIGGLDYVVAGGGGLAGDTTSLRVGNNTVVQPEGRALHVIASGPVSIDGNFFSSLGHHGADVATDRFALGDVVFVQNLGAPWEASGLAQHVGFDEELGVEAIEGFTVAQHTLPYLRNTELASPRFFIGTGGSVSFNNNQVVYDWDIVGLPPTGSAAPTSFFPVVLLGLDHIAVNGNHVALRMVVDFTPSPSVAPIPGAETGTRLLAGMFVMGATVEVSRNRMAEMVGRVVYSLLTVGEIMNITALNQTTHDNLALVTVPDDSPTTAEADNVLREELNQVLFTLTSPTVLESDVRVFINQIFTNTLRGFGQ